MAANYQSFWRTFQNQCSLRTTLFDGLKLPPSKHNWWNKSAGISDIEFHIRGPQPEPLVALKINKPKTGDEAPSNLIFDRLKEKRSEIERTFGASLSWERRPSQRRSVIGKYFIATDEKDWRLLAQEMAAAAAKLEAAISPFLRDAVRSTEHLSSILPASSSRVNQTVEKSLDEAAKGAVTKNSGRDFDDHKLPPEPSLPDEREIQEGRRRILRTLAARRGQQSFRRKVEQAYGGRCAISGCAVREALEAAHILPRSTKEFDSINNGLLLRSDLHALFDEFLVSIDPGSHRVLLAPTLKNSEYRQFDRIRIAKPQAGCDPWRTVLDWHYGRFCRENRHGK